MNLSFSDRAEISRKVRAILVKNWIDLGRVSFHVSMNGNVNIEGSLLKLPGTGELTPQIVAEMIGELEHVQRVMRVEAEFDNWIRAGFAGLWSQTAGKAANAQQSRLPSDGGPGQVIDIKLRSDGEVE